MKGVIFNLTEQVVSDAYGPEVWDDILDGAGLEGAYTSLGSYPDDEFTAIVMSGAARLEVDPMVVVRTVAEGAMPHLAQRYPQFFAPHASTRPFLLTLNDIIHAEVRKLYPGAEVPEFAYEDASEDVFLMHYRSPRRLCALAEGFIAGAATHYGEKVVVDQTQCMLDGAPYCILRCAFEPA